MNSPLFPDHQAPSAPAEMLISTPDAPEVLTGPMPARLELMPRADGAERFAPLIARIDNAEAHAMAIKIADGDSDEIIRAKAAQARRMRLDIFRPSRVEADKLHADLKSGVLEIGRRLDKARADFRTRCERIEDHLANVENELKRREAAAAAARLAARTETIAPYAIEGLPFPAWPDDEEQFNQILAAQKSAHAGWKAQLEAERQAKEEAARKEEEERKATEAKRQQELAEAQRAKAEAEAKLEAERTAAAEQRRKDEAAKEEERKQQQAELERIRKENEKQLAAEREQRRKDQEAAAERDRERIAAENERKRKEQIRERERQAAKAKLEKAARMLASALEDAAPALDGDLAAAAAAALAYWSEVEAAL